MKRGRNKRLISLRDAKLIERYYYWTEVKRRRFDDTLKILSEQEFFLSESRIETILRINNDSLNLLIGEKKKTNQLSLFNN